jgi:hypothetical protein
MGEGPAPTELSRKISILFPKLSSPHAGGADQVPADTNHKMRAMLGRAPQRAHNNEKLLPSTYSTQPHHGALSSLLRVRPFE